jgi:hypothetical protein
MPSGLTYTPATGYSGTDAFTIRISDGIANATTSISVTIIGTPAPGTITGPSSLPLGSSAIFTSSVAGGTWNSSNPSAASIASSGLAYGMSTGYAVISYTVSGACGTATASVNVAVTTPAAGIAPETGLDDLIKETRISIYPNPVQSAFTLNAPGSGTLYLYDMRGQLIAEYSINEGDNSLQMKQGLAPGTYIGKFAGENGATASVRISYQP